MFQSTALIAEKAEEEGGDDEEKIILKLFVVRFQQENKNATILGF